MQELGKSARTATANGNEIVCEYLLRLTASGQSHGRQRRSGYKSARQPGAPIGRRYGCPA